ncbi:hypothetical protein Tco_0901006 [Tanacetum coccineum]
MRRDTQITMNSIQLYQKRLKDTQGLQKSEEEAFKDATKGSLKWLQVTNENARIGAVHNFCFNSLNKLLLISAPIKFDTFSWRRPIFDRFNLGRVNVNTSTVNHVTEELYSGDPEFTLGELGVQFFLLKQFQDLPKGSP